MVRAHLERCFDCRSFEGVVGAFSAELRAAPLERRTRRFAVSRPAHYRWGTQAVAQAGVAAMLVVGVVGVTTHIGERERAMSSGASEGLFESAWTPDVEQEQLVSGAPKKWRVGKRHGSLFAV